MSNQHHLENPYLVGTPAGGSSASSYPSQTIPQNLPWGAPPRPYPAGFPATANPDNAYGPRFVVRLFPNSYYPVYLRWLQAPGNCILGGYTRTSSKK
jgi:hypothetical protein